MRQVFISWEERRDAMEQIAGDSGSTCYEQVAEEFHVWLRQQHGPYGTVDLEFEQGTPEEEQELRDFIEQEEE